MRSRILVAVAAIVALCVGFGSCLEDKEQELLLSSSAIVKAFALDTIKGKSYTFSIDQLNRVIFNADSLPLHSDTLMSDVKIDSFSVTGYLTSGLTDTIVNINNRQDLRKAVNNEVGMRFMVTATDRSKMVEYTLHIRIHQQDPDSLQWTQMGDLPKELKQAPLGNDHRMVARGKELLMFYHKDGEVTVVKADISDPTRPQWSAAVTAGGLPGDAMVQSIMESGSSLYACTQSGDVYSSADGVAWQKSDALSGGVTALLASTDNKLCGIRKGGDDTLRFWVATESGWEEGEVVDKLFPTKHIYSTPQASSTSAQGILLVGASAEKGRTTPWMTMDGLRWGRLDTDTEFYCPEDTSPIMMLYNGEYYFLGKETKNFYASKSGIAWDKAPGKFMLPPYGDSPTALLLATDSSGFIWILAQDGKGQSQLWRGRLNKLGFDRK